MPGRVVGLAGTLVVGLATLAGALQGVGDVRVLSGPAAETVVTVGAGRDTVIDDRTPGARPAAEPGGPASSGETFTDEITLLLRDVHLARPAAIEVNDPVVSAVRMFPEESGTLVTIFVRQPATYTVSRPSALGEVQVTVRGKARPLTVTGTRRPGRPRIAAPAPTGEREVAVDAESLSYDQATNTLTARGGVTLTRGDTTLTADEVVYDRTNEIAEARGHVVLRDPQATIEGTFAHLNLADESGWIEESDTTFHPSTYFLRAGKLEKQGGPRYSVARGVFTTCECGGLEKPSWSIAGQRTDVTLQGTGVVRGATFRVKDVPVLYAPYLVFPANTERQSGFLIPRVGYSNRRGFQYEQPFFWAINKSSDATLGLDVESEARLGVLGEYRYVLSQRGRGAFTGSYYNESIRGRTVGVLGPNGLPADIPENRFGVAGHHVQRFGGGSKFYLDMLAVSDDLFLREMNTFAFAGRTELSLRSLRFTTSRTGLYKPWNGGLAWGEVAYHQDLVDDQDVTLQKLPRLEAEHSVPLLNDRVVGRLAGQAIDFQRAEGFDGVRGDLAPDLFVPFRVGRAFNGSVTGRLRETVYHLTDRDQVALVVPDPESGLQPFFRAVPELQPGPARRQLADLDENRSRELAEVHARSGTALTRVFDFPHLGLERVKHTIEPEVQYLFVPATSRPADTARATFDCAEIPGGTPGRTCPVTLFTEGYLFDERDAINRRNFFSYGFSSRLLGRPASGAPPQAPAPEEDEEDGGDEEDEPTTEPSGGVDQDMLPAGLSADAVPGFVGPPRARSTAAAGALPPARELARATMLHGYDVSRALVGSSHQSDIDVGLRVTPLDYLGASSNATVSAEDRSLRGLNVGLFMREPWWRPTRPAENLQSPTTIGLSYRFIDESVNRDAAAGSVEALALRSAGVNEFDASVYLRLGQYLGFTFLMRYDLNTTVVPTGELGPHFLERDYLVRLISRCNCWVLEAGFADKFNPDERSLRVQFTLVGLGSFGRATPNRNYVGMTALSDTGYRRPGIGP
jgi:LPS-assembly protein